MNILIACEESQAVCKEMRRLGHEAFSADIQDCSGGHPEWHINGDVLPLINGCCEFITMDGQLHKIPGKWDLIIAHPPCTYLTKAGACCMYIDGAINDDRFQKSLAARDFFLKFLAADCAHIAVENPVPMAMVGLPPYSQLIQPYQFGDPYSKKTCLWLKGLPPLMGTVICSDYVSWTSLFRSAKMRSKTFPGIAAAMAEQWTYYIDLCNEGDSFIADI